MSSSKFVSLLMSSRNQAHTFHIVTNSHAQHKALESYYEDIVPLLDAWAETYMGQYGRLKNVKMSSRIITNPAMSSKYFRGLLKQIRSLKLPRDTWLKNIQDEIVALINRTLYKLTLK